MATSSSYADSEKKRWVSRIMAITFRIAKDLPPGTISRSWVAKTLNRSEDFVKKNWNKDPFNCEMNSKQESHHESLSQESKEIIQSWLKKKKSIRELIEQIEQVRGKVKSYGSIHRYLRSLGAKPFHQVPRPLISKTNREDRLWFVNYLSNWDIDDFMHLAPSDEFFIYESRRPNYQNDRIWALDIDDIPEDVKVRQTSKYPACIGIFLLFTANKLLWVVKDQGQKWSGDYFREVILAQHVIPFLKNPRNVLDVQSTTFLHDRAPCMSAFATQNLLKANGIDFFGNSEWPGSSPDLNPCEHLGAILKQRVENRIINGGGSLKVVLNEELETLKYDKELFGRLLASYASRLDAVQKANGGPTEY